MSELSELYVPQYQYDYNQAMGRYESEVVYPWRDITNYEEYYQSFNKYPERGYIDQTIFGFKRMDDDWSLGAYCSSIFTKNENGVGMSNATFYFHTSKNSLSKNQAALTSVPNIFSSLVGTQGMYSHMNSYDLINHHQYSPDATKMAGYAATFISNFRYNKYCLIPKFSLIYTDGGGPIFNIPYNGIDQTRPFIVIGLKIDYVYAGSIPYIYPCFVQFAGEIQSCGSGVWLEPQMGEVVPAVYEMIGCNVIFGGLINNGQFIVNITDDVTQTAFINLPHLLTERHDTNGRAYWGMTLENAVTIVNRLGFYWTKAYTYDGSDLGTHCTDPDISVPVIDEETHTVTTQVLEGSDIAQYAYEHPDNILNCDVGAEDYNGKTFAEFREDYDSHQSTVDEAEEIDLNEPTSATSGGNTVWIMSEEKIKEFFMWLWNPDGTIFDDIVKALALLGENPMDSVVTLKLYPFDISRTNATYQYADICFGRKKSPINAPHLTSSNVIIFDMGSFYFNDAGMQNDFRDYEPYSDYSLYIPFVGIIQLQAIECIGTQISVKMIVDLITGSATAVVFTNGVPYKYLDGQIGIEMPVTGRNMADYGKTILAGALAGAMTGGKMANKSGLTQLGREIAQRGERIQDTAVENASFLESDATGRWGNQAAKGAAMQVAGASFGTLAVVAGAAIGGGLTALMNAPQPETAGSNSPATGLAKPLYPYFIVRRSDCWIPENYNHLYGRPLNEGGVVGDFTGFSVFASVKVENIDGATPEEVKLIVDLLQSGVYL